MEIQKIKQELYYETKNSLGTLLNGKWIFPLYEITSKIEKQGISSQKTKELLGATTYSPVLCSGLKTIIEILNKKSK